MVRTLSVPQLVVEASLLRMTHEKAYPDVRLSLDAAYVMDFISDTFVTKLVRP